jgi:hypothetical protein
VQKRPIVSASGRGGINNKKIKDLIVKETIFRIYFVLKRVWKIICEKDKGLTAKT